MEGMLDDLLKLIQDGQSEGTPDLLQHQIEMYEGVLHRASRPSRRFPDLQREQLRKRWLDEPLIEEQKGYMYRCMILIVCYLVLELVGREHKMVSPSADGLQGLLFVMLVYSLAIPGIPFRVAACICWGVMGVALQAHLSVVTTAGEGGSGGMQPYGAATDSHWTMLSSQMVRLLLFNLFGTLVASEHTRQTRCHCWREELLQEAVELHKVVKQRFHRLMQNTTPPPPPKGSAALAAETQAATDDASAAVRAVRVLFNEAVRSALRMSSFATTTVLVLFGVCDYVLWQNDRPVATLFYLRCYIGAAVAAVPMLVLTYLRHLQGRKLVLTSLLLLVGPWMCALCLVIPAPGPHQSHQYGLTIALLQLWSGYTTLSLPTPMLACLQFVLSGVYSVAYLRSSPNEEALPLGRLDLFVHLLGAHVLGILHNHRRRRRLRDHAKLPVMQLDRMKRMRSEIAGCAAWLGLENGAAGGVLGALRNCDDLVPNHWLPRDD